MKTNKFTGINFPFYGIDYVPDEVYITNTEIKVRIGNNRKTVYLEKHRADNYLATLYNLDGPGLGRLQFTSTSRTLGELLLAKSKWGLDNSGHIHNLAKKEKFPLKVFKVDKIKNNLVWLKGLSHPIIVGQDLEDEEFKENLIIYYVEMAYINYSWEFLKLNLSYNNKQEVWI